MCLGSVGDFVQGVSWSRGARSIPASRSSKTHAALAKAYPLDYTQPDIEVRQTDEFASWFAALRDREARARVLARVRRLSLGAVGDVASVGGGVLELRVHCGPGYRVYFVRRGARSIVLLTGGDKRRQSRDIALARRLARELED